jgi:DNA-directed RNA polymerase II subunit RPB1
MNKNYICQTCEPETNNVVGVQFSIMSPDEIKNRSVVEVTKHETYDKDIPIIKGLFDIRMGTTDMDKICGTCGQNNINCPGHFGHIDLARPVYHYQFLSILHKVLKCTCIQCSKILINKDSPKVEDLMKKSNKTRWNSIYEMSQKISRCGQETEDGCGARQPDKIKVEGMDGIFAVWNKLDDKIKTQHLSVEEVRSILEKISNEDINILGFSDVWCRPEWMICSVFPIPPPSVRPSVKQDDSQRMDDDLTHKLCDIIKCNNVLKQKIESNSRSEVIDDWTKVLQYHISTMIDNELPGVAQSVHRSGRALKAIRQRLKGKDGRIRNNLMGKRVDFSARSVITPDPNIELDELGVPFSIAKNLTYPEIVNQYNKDRIQKLLNNGPNVYPGVKIIEQNGIKKTINERNVLDIELNNGDIVHRHLIDGDFVLFNRQPSLHKMSMMGHRVKVMKGNTFRLNVSVTPPYNADFDGDEMNMHAPQSISTVSELMNIASVVYQIISPRENKPIITIVQDTLLGINKLTKGEIIKYKSSSSDSYYFSNNTNIYPIKKTSEEGISKMVVDTSYFNRSQVMNLISSLSTFDGVLPESSMSIDMNGKKVEYWSGKTIISYIIPPHINLTMTNDSYDNLKENDEIKNMMNKVIIENGNLISGGMDKAMFTKTSKGLIHTIYNDIGPERCKDFIDDLQKIVSYFLLIEGFSVGIGDMVADNKTYQKISNVIKDNKVKIDKISQEIHLNIFENFSGQTNNEFFEGKVNSLLNDTLRQTGNIGLENLDQKNRVTNMVNSGSKGKSTNIAQIVACLGQQNVDGKRIPYGFIDRTLPHYSKYDDSSEARGFVENSFISGQTPQEYFFHAMGGREGLIDTAVKTSETGYIQRKLVKSMEDLRVEYDYSVRNSSGCVIQFIYGDDGMDATFVESQPLHIMNMNTEDIAKKYLFTESQDWESIISKGVYTEMSKNKNYQEIINKSFYELLDHKKYIFENIFNNKELNNNINYPIHIKRIVSNMCNLESDVSDISPIDILHQNEKLKKSLIITETFKNNKVIEILIDIHLNPKVLITQYKIQESEYDEIIKQIKYLFEKSLISPGEMVGAVAAQSIGEPATQMTLNTFHYAGVSSKSNVTRGIPRLRELLGVTKNLKSPSTTLYLKDSFKENQAKSQYVKNKIEYTVVKDIVTRTQIYYDPKNTVYETDIEEDKGFLEIYKEFLDIEKGESFEYEDTAPWIIRFTFNKELMMENGIVMEDVYLAISNYDNEKLQFIYSDDNSKQLIGRVSIKADIKGSEEELLNGLLDQSDSLSIFKKIQEDLLNNVVIKGIKGITNIVMGEKSNYVKENDEIIQKKYWVLETDGINLLDIFNSPFVDFVNTYSNDILEVNSVLGIEAARNILIEEITGVMSDASYINNRHIELLCDIMTNKGYLSAINRQGINRGDTGPLAKCSFEDTTDQLIKAGVFGEKDKLNGVSSNIMMGQTIKSGTGMCNLYLDERKMLEEMKNISLTTDDFIEVSENNIDTLLNEDSEEENTNCLDEDFEMSGF